MTSRKKAPGLFTIGYEKATVAAFFDELRRHRVELIADVRAVTASRRPGFSKRQLSAGLDEIGIGYVHFSGLGTPAEGREASRSGHPDKMYAIYERHLETPKAREDMDALLATLRAGKRVCLLCYERDIDHCHRRRVAELVCEAADLDVAHLAPTLF
ncbi:MAG: hypothetical protein QOD74_629 [Variibacter sp.]|jgi:uncharacterized protein (DUF488 family)|nr:hypothetical protein [Variibacter sp.]